MIKFNPREAFWLQDPRKRERDNLDNRVLTGGQDIGITSPNKWDGLVAGVMCDSKNKCIWDGLLADMTCDSVLKGVALLDYQRDPRLTRFQPSCDNLCKFLLAMQLRLMVPVMMQMGLVQYFNTIFETNISFSEFFVFVETFLAVYEVECLTHVCIERYVVAKYITNGWPLQKKHYTLYQFLSLMFALLYATPPLYGIGKYGDEFSCRSYTVDYILPDSWQRYVILTIFFMRSVKPAAFMITMLVWARTLESNMKSYMKKQTDLHFTRMVIVLTGCNLTCWAPLAWIKAKLLLNQFLFDLVAVPKSDTLLKATCLQECAPLLSASLILLFHITRSYFGRPRPITERKHST